MNAAPGKAPFRVEQVNQQHFPCQECGADLIYQPGVRVLKCEYCGHENPIIDEPVTIREYDFNSALKALSRSKLQPLDSTQVIKCPNCAAAFELKTNEHAGDCPFCGTPVVSSTEQERLFQPKALLPFAITEQQARASFDKWITGLWFAPSALKNKAERDERLLGIYVPYWTYDSHTASDYDGMRGTVYYERQVVTELVNGRYVQREINVPRIRWTPVSGRVYQTFDDVLVGATRSLPRSILDELEPWDMNHLVAYNQAYLSGFRSEIYQVDLDEGFQQARVLMENAIHRAIRMDIGGDQQQINAVNTRYSDTTYKHILLPVWSAAFRYQGETYRFVINGRNGKTQGQRPYSKVKIIFAVLGAIILTIIFAYALQASGALDYLQQQGVQINTDYYYPKNPNYYPYNPRY
ncbi:hypothetical protein [Thiolinea disciformis]|uniref:hypothetical protein n=1 Tax=Thiolinea disciformis TaxID=125614 RepID=UPI00037A2857|nr:hypothetical protein [Thiolinea disciformis]